MIAHSLHPSEEELMRYGAARVNLDAELREAVRNGELTVRNRAGFGRHKFPEGAALLDSVVFPHDLVIFLNDRGIDMRLIPHGSGPGLWTLENAALALAEQLRLTDESRGTLLDQMVVAANNGVLTVRHPHTDLPTNTGSVRTYYELVTRKDVNRWLSSIDAPYQWECDGSDELDEPAVIKTQTVPASRAPVVGGSAKAQWTAQARDLAAKYVDAWRAAGFEPTISDAAVYVEGELFIKSIFNTRGGVIDWATIKREALTGITERRPGEKRSGRKIPKAQRQGMPMSWGLPIR
jgi:hypothetical protein